MKYYNLEIRKQGKKDQKTNTITFSKKTMKIRKIT